MRKLQTQDVFKMARIIKAANLKEEIKRAIEGANLKGSLDQSGIDQNDKVVEKVGMDVFFTVLEACGDHTVEKLFYDFLAGITEKSEEDIRTMSLDGMAEAVKQIIRENNMSVFFKAAGRFPLK